MKSLNHKSVFVTLLISFILVLLLPIVVEIWLYQKMEGIISEKEEQSNTALLKQVSNSLDQEIHQVNLLASQIMYNPRLQFILSDSHNDKSFTQYHYLMRDMKASHQTNEFIYDYFLHLPEHDSVITPEIKTDIETFYQSYYQFKGMTEQEVSDLKERVKNETIYIPALEVYKGVSSEAHHIISYVQPLPYNNLAGPKGYISILINQNSIQQTIMNEEWMTKGNIYILDQNNNQLLTTDTNNDQINDLAFEFTNENGSIETIMNNEKMIMSYVVSPKTGWKYVSIVPKSIVMEKVNNLKVLALSLLAFALTSGLFACYYLAYRHYTPIKELVHFIGHKGEKEEVFPKNEYHLIRETLNQTFTNEMELKNKLIEHTPQIKANFFIRLLNGFIEEESISDESLAFMELELESNTFTVLLIEIEENGRIQYEDQEKTWAITRFIISNVFNDVTKDVFNHFMIELDQKQIGIILNPKELDSIELIKDVLFSVQSILKESFDIRISIGIGQNYKGMNKVVQSYREAIQALNYRMIKGNEQIIQISETNAEEHIYDYTEGTEALLMNFIKVANYEKAEGLLDKIYEDNFKSRNISFEAGKCLFFNIMNTHLKILNDMNVKYEFVLLNEENPVEQLLMCKTAEDMHNKTKVIYKQLCSFIQENRHTQQNQLIEKIIRFITKEYANPNLSSSLIAADMDITPQYLSSFFKKQTGENVTDYIAKMRLEDAKRLLESGNLTISEIAGQVGYANDVGLIRLFKKYEGITPGNYRESIKENVMS